MESLIQDLRAGVHHLVRSPGFALTAGAVLALGIGAATALFTVADRVLIRPLPYHEPERLVSLWEWNPDMGWAPDAETQVAPANGLDWRDQVDAFEDLALYSEFVNSVVLTGAGEPVRLDLAVATGNVFGVLGVPPQLGRTFTDDETWSTSEPVTILSHRLWQQTFGGDPDIVGRVITLAGEGYEVIGVMPADLQYLIEPTELWVTPRWEPSYRDRVSARRAHIIRAVARVRDDVTMAEARAQLETVAARLEVEYPETNTNMGAGFSPLQRFLAGDTRLPLLVLLGAVGLLLLIACVNVGNLLLVRSVGRAREFAVRAALGAGWGRIARQLLAESLLISLLGGAMGLGVGAALLKAFQAMAPPELMGLAGASLDARAAGFALAVTVLSGLFFGAFPAVRSSRTDVTGSLKDGARGGTVGRGTQRAGTLLVTAEVALALTLVVGAGLLVRSFQALRSVDAGFDGRGVLTFALDAYRAYPDEIERIGLYQRVHERVEALPGVVSAGAVRKLPLTGRSWSSSYSIEGREPSSEFIEVVHREATAGYFPTMEIPLLEGRLFETTDVGEAPLVVVINQAMADVAFSGENPVGRRIAFDREPTETSNWWTIIGVVGNERFEARSEPLPEIIAHAFQDPPGALRFVVEVHGDPMGVVAAARQALKEVDAGMVLEEVRSMEQVRAGAVRGERFLMTLMGGFGGVALLLSALGVYGVAAQAARRRTREIGIRIALGAGSPDVVGMVMRRGLSLTLAGVVVGMVLAGASSRVMASLLYGVAPLDLVTFAVVPLVLALAAVVATAGPALRATRVDPVEALRAE